MNYITVLIFQAMQLRDYDDIIDPIDAHSLIALTASLNKAFGVCSRVRFDYLTVLNARVLSYISNCLLTVSLVEL